MKPQFIEIWIQKVTINGDMDKMPAYINLDDIARIAREPIYAQVANAITRQMEVRRFPCPKEMTTITTRTNVQFFVDKETIGWILFQNSADSKK